MADVYPREDVPIDRPTSPWWLIARGVGIASDPRNVILAALGLTTLHAGWLGLARTLGPVWLHRVSQWPGSLGFSAERSVGRVLWAVGEWLAPFVALFQPGLSPGERLGAGLASLWTLVVWGLFGGAIVRVAAVRVATGGRVGIVSALAFSGRRLGSLVAAPIAPILVALLIGLAGAAVGLLDRLPGSIGTSAATVLAIIPLVVGLLDAVLLLGLALAWPLMVATVVAEGEDFFDAISRSYSYVNQRMVRYAAYLTLAALVGAVGVTIVGLFVAAALGLADWSVGLGAPYGRGFRFLDPTSDAHAGLPAVAHAWTGIARALASGWISSYVWTTAAIFYLVLRHDVDGADVHDIYEPGHEPDAFAADEPSTKPAPSS